MALKKVELFAELHATNEQFVRDKYMRGSYSPAKLRLVGQWLADLDTRRAAERAELAAQRTARWTMIGGISVALTFFLTFGVAALPLLK